jgi:hypothetical protein
MHQMRQILSLAHVLQSINTWDITYHVDGSGFRDLIIYRTIFFILYYTSIDRSDQDNQMRQELSLAHIIERMSTVYI